MSMALWEAIHAGTPFVRPSPVVCARRQTALTKDDLNDWILPPDENTVPVPGVYFAKRAGSWQVKIRNPPGSARKFFTKSGFFSQAQAVEYLQREKANEIWD